MKSLVLTLASKALPILALIFVTCLLLYKLYVHVRTRFGITVNCWFCNTNSRVAYVDRNSWNCPNCEQYNGFNGDGDYNRDILSQRDSSTRSEANSSMSNSGVGKGDGIRNVHCANAYYGSTIAGGLSPPQDNGLCNQCNEAQRVKVEKLAQFEPRNEARFDQELKRYKNELEQQYRLCDTCERHVNRVLHEKKKMVLGSKLLNFIMKGAALLKQPYYEHLARAQKQRRLMRYQLWMKVLTLLNIICLLCTLPTATLEQFTQLLGSWLSKPIYLIYTHFLTMLHLVLGYAGEWLSEQPFACKLWMFANILGKLLIYTVGMPQAQAAQATFSSCYTSVYPYAMLTLSLISNIVSGFKLTRYTLLLVLWSIYAKGSVLLFEAINGVTFILLGSLGTLIVLHLRDSSRLEQLSASESFHQLCADECINDDETISLLSQQLSHNASNASNASNPDYLSMIGSRYPSPYTDPQLRSTLSPKPPAVAPSVLSLDSLHLSSQRTPINTMPASSFRSLTPMYSAASLDQQAWRRNYGMNMNQNPAEGSILQRPTPNYPAAGQSTYGFGIEQRTRSTHNLLYPSRLHMQQHQQRAGDISAWVNAASVHSQPELLQEPSTANLMQCSNNREFSRTSSQSSGFESQLGNQRMEQPQQWPPGGAASAGGSVDHVSMYNRDYGMPLRVSPVPVLPFGGQSSQDYRPGDLLRKWMDRDGIAKPN